MDSPALAIPIRTAVPFREFGRVNWIDPEPELSVDPEYEYVEFLTAT
jgi:hypothetical protein